MKGEITWDRHNNRAGICLFYLVYLGGKSIGFFQERDDESGTKVWVGGLHTEPPTEFRPFASFEDAKTWVEREVKGG